MILLAIRHSLRCHGNVSLDIESSCSTRVHN